MQENSREEAQMGHASPKHHEADSLRSDPFPWDIGIFDAHCHPTDSMTSLASLPRMKARALTIMSTRSQDQELVSAVAEEQGVVDSHTLFSPYPTGPGPDRRIVPSFGWHPWFSYQLYDDRNPDVAFDGSAESKAAHYDRILTPAPSSKDSAFSTCLQDPWPLSEFLRQTKDRLEKFPYALVGEIGIDKAFRLPESWTAANSHNPQRTEELTPGGREGRRLSPFRVSLPHQNLVLKDQLRLAGELGRPVSVHGVQAHGALFSAISETWKGHELEVLSRRQKRRIAENAEDFSDFSSEDEDEEGDADLKKPGHQQDKVKKEPSTPKPYPPRICLHSFSGSTEMARQYAHPSVPAKVFFSFSAAINLSYGDEGKRDEVVEVIKAIPANRLLIESDLHTIENLDASLEEVCKMVCDVRGWELREGLTVLAKNWREFVFDDV